MPSDVLAVADRLWNGELSTSTFHPVDHIGGFVEITDGVGFCPSFANVSVLRHRGRPGPGRHRQRPAGPDRPRRHPHLEPGPPQHRGLLPRPHRPRLRRAGLGAGGGRRRAGPPPRSSPTTRCPPASTATSSPPATTPSSTAGSSASPTCSGRPSTATRTGPTTTRWSSRSAACGFSLRHEKGETDDHTVTWQPDTRVLCCGDLFIWASPNAGNPQKVQRYPREWAAALRRMLQLDAEFLLPGHGFPVIGADRVRTALTDTADLLDSLVDQTLAVMNAGGRLDDAIHAVRVPAALADRPFLQPVYDEPEFIVHTVWRQYGGWWDGNPATLQPAPERALAARAGGAGRRGRCPGRPGPRAAGRRRPTRPSPTGGAAEGALRLAGHLAEHAWLAQPDDEGVQRARQQVFAARAARATSTMARGVFTWAANESTAPPHCIRTDRSGAPAISNFFAGFDSVGAVDSSLTSPSSETPETPARSAKKSTPPSGRRGGRPGGPPPHRLPAPDLRRLQGRHLARASPPSTSGRASSSPASSSAASPSC